MESKVCKECKVDKPLSEYYTWPQDRTKYRGKCKACIAEYNKAYLNENHDVIRAKQLVYNEANRHRTRERGLQRNYGMTQADFDSMLEAQNGKCKICHRSAEEAQCRHGVLHVDHDHKTGEVRYLLCDRCNRTLGLLEEDVELMEAMIEYVR